MQLPDVSSESLLKLFHTDLYGVPLFSILMFVGASAIGGGLYWRRGTTVERRIVERNNSGLPSAQEFAENDGKYLFEELKIPEDEESSNPPRVDGSSDLEDRLINALAQAPWKVKEGSEISLEKNESNKWGISTKKIEFVLGRDGEAQTQSPEPLPPNPEAQEATE